MTIDVLIFGAAALAAKADRVRVTVGDAPTVGEVAAAVARQHAFLKLAMDAGRLAVNHAFAKPEDAVRPGDEVALIALVGGG